MRGKGALSVGHALRTTGRQRLKKKTAAAAPVKLINLRHRIFSRKLFLYKKIAR